MSEEVELELSTVTPMQARDIIISIAKKEETDLPIMLWSSPGIGKSSICNQAAEELGIGLIDIRLLLFDPVDFRIPFLAIRTKTGEIKIISGTHSLKRDEEIITMFARPHFLPEEGRGIILWDELAAAPPSIQASAYQIILDRKLGEHKLGDGWIQVAASNLTTDRAIVHRMPTPLADRFVHLLMKPSINDWKIWAYTNNIDSRIISFLSKPENQQYLFKFDPKKDSKTFPTPRGWEKVSKILQLPVSNDLREKLIAGKVGAEAAVAFRAWLEYGENLPDFIDILKGKINSFSKIPNAEEDANYLYSLVSGLINTFVSLATNPNEKKIPLNLAAENFFQFIMTLPMKEFIIAAGVEFQGVYTELSRKKLMSFNLLKDIKSFSEYTRRYYDDYLDASTG